MLVACPSRSPRHPSGLSSPPSSTSSGTATSVSSWTYCQSDAFQALSVTGAVHFMHRVARRVSVRRVVRTMSRKGRPRRRVHTPDATGADVQEQVAVGQRRQAVCDHEGGATLHEALHRLHDPDLVVNIDGTRRLVEDQGGGILQESSG